jgi:hypothetical protein
MAKTYEIINNTNECELKIFSLDITHRYTINKRTGYTKKFYEQLLKDIENYKQGVNYDDYIAGKIVDFPFITCYNGEMYFINSSSYLGTTSEIKLSNKTSKDILVELISYL